MRLLACIACMSLAAAAPLEGILSNLTNPVFQRGNWSTKDASMIHDKGSNLFILAFSAFST